MAQVSNSMQRIANPKSGIRQATDDSLGTSTRRLQAELTAVHDLHAAVGEINPRPPGLHNGAIQLMKKAMRRMLTWYTRPLHAFHGAVARALQEEALLLDSLRRSIDDLQRFLQETPSGHQQVSQKIDQVVRQPQFQRDRQQLPLADLTSYDLRDPLRHSERQTTERMKYDLPAAVNAQVEAQPQQGVFGTTTHPNGSDRLRQIHDVVRRTDYDFRATACPDDPFPELWSSQVLRFRTKWAISRALQPLSILEIGVKHGYSAAAFLAASSQARYLGIEFTEMEDVPLKWARRITSSYAADFALVDRTAASRLLSARFDLVHMNDSSASADWLFEFLEQALPKAKYLLIDSQCLSRQNFRAVSEYIYLHRDTIDDCSLLSSYGGDLLIGTGPSSDSLQHDTSGCSSLSVRGAYTSHYYLEDCGGYVQYAKNRGKQLEDARLVAVAAIASIKNAQRVLDVGCGRGELTYHFATSGSRVTAVDYSPAAIELAEETFAGEDTLRSKVDFVCGNICTVPLEGKYDLVVASDVIEHLVASELEVLYGRLSDLLRSDGIFVVHTYPNVWFYKYEYPRRRRLANSIGAYLAPQPRSPYEARVHINEQSPRLMRRALNKHFRYVELWFGDPLTPAGSLAREFSRAEMRSAPDLFAMAANEPIDREGIVLRLQSTPLPASVDGLGIEILACPERVQGEHSFTITVRVINQSGYHLNTFPPNPVHISYRWIDKSGVPLGRSSVRFPLGSGLPAGRSAVYSLQIHAPRTSGDHMLRITLVQEWVRWFDDPPFNLMEDIKVDVLPC